MERIKFIFDLLKIINPLNVWRKIRQTDTLKKITNENTELKQKLSEYESFEKKKAELEFRDNIYFHKQTKDQFCPRCFDSEQNLIHLINTSPKHWHCANCKNSFFSNLPQRDTNYSDNDE